MFVYLVKLFNSPNEIRIAGGIFKINIICNERKKKDIILIQKITQLKMYFLCKRFSEARVTSR